MSEYIEIEAELDEDGRTIFFQTNLPLTAGEATETYDSPEALAFGSPVAQMLAGIDGITAAEITGDVLLVVCESPAGWHMVAADVSAALKDLYL
ncbi:MAG: hypothetical protein R3C44_12395 [Chloroflexota bacterium]